MHLEVVEVCRRERKTCEGRERLVKGEKDL